VGVSGTLCGSVGGTGVNMELVCWEGEQAIIPVRSMSVVNSFIA